MATYTWIGAAGGLYATTTNWSPTGLPAAADDIVFTGNATPNVGTTARTVRNFTVNSGTVTFSGTGAFTIQGDISNLSGSSGSLNMTTMTVNFTGGNSQTLNLGTNSFTSCTINKTNGTNITLGAAWNITGTATSTLTVTNGNLYTSGYTVTCRAFIASGNTDRTIDLSGGAIYVTGSSGTLWNTSHTTATGTAWTKFARSGAGAAYIQPSSGTSTITVTGGGIASNYTAGATFNGVPPTFQLGNNRNYTVTGQFEDLEVNGNFAGTSAPQIWGNLTGTPVSYNNVTTTNPVIIGRTGVTNGVNWRAQVTSYTTQNPLNGTPDFFFYFARAVTFTLSSNTSTYNLWIDGNDTTGAAWQTAAFTVVCSGNNSTYNENIIRSTSTLTYTAAGTGSSYTHTDFYDNNTASAYTFGGNASTVHNIASSFNTLGTVNFNFGTLNLATSMYCRIFNSATGTGASGNQRIFNFNNYWIYINGNHRSGTNGTGTLSIATLNNTVCTSDSGSTDGGFWLQTTGTCTTGSWQDTNAIRFRVEALASTTLNASITGCNLRSLEFFGPVNFATAQTINLINDNASIYWDEQGTAFNLNNLTATIASSTVGTFTILQNASSLANANYRLGTLSTLNTSMGDDQTYNIFGYVRTLSLTKNTGTFNLYINYAQVLTCSGGAGTTYNYESVGTANPFTATWTPITGTSVAAPITKFQVPVKSTSGSGTGATFNIAKTGTGTTYSGITVAALGINYAIDDTITISGAELDGIDGTNDLTFTIASATKCSLGGQAAGSTPASISGTAVNTAQTRTNVPVKSSTGGGNDAFFSVTKTGTGVVYFGVTTAIITSGTYPADGSTIVLSGAGLGGVDGTNDLTFTFRATGTQHNLSTFQCPNTLDFVAGTINLSASTTIGNFTSTYTNLRTINFNSLTFQLSRTVTIGSTSQNLTIENPGGFDVAGTGTINTSGLSAVANNNFDIHWRNSNTFTTGSAIRNLYVYSGAALSTTSAITVNIRGAVLSGDNTGGTGPFTGLTISFPAVATPGDLTQQFNLQTPTVIPSVTVLGSCILYSINTTTLTLNPGSDHTVSLNANDGYTKNITTLTLTGTGGTINLSNPDYLNPPRTSVTFSGNATYNLTGFTSTTGGVSCAGTSDNCVYNLQNLYLTGTGTANRFLFDGRGTLNLISDIQVDRFDITNTTVPRTLNFNDNSIYFTNYPASISCNLTTTTVIGQTNTTGGFYIMGQGATNTSADNQTVTVNGQTESNALNLRVDYVPVTLAGTLVYRSLMPTLGIKNTTGTLTIYGNYEVNSYYTPFNGVTINFAGNDPNEIQRISTFGLGPNTATMSGLSPKLVVTSWIKTLTTQNTTVVVPSQLYCDQIIVQGTTFKVGGTIYTNYWNNTDPSTYYWKGPGYLRIANSETQDPATYGFLGNTSWTSYTELFNSTSSRGAGTGPNLIMDNNLKLDASTTQDPHRVRFLRRTLNPGSGLTNPIKIGEFFEDVGGTFQQYNLKSLNLIFDPSASSQNNFRISSTYNMDTTSSPIYIPNISSSNSTITIEPTSSNLYLSKIEFDDTTNTSLITNSKNLTVGKIICGNAEFGNSVVTLTGGNDTIFDTGVVAANSVISTEKNYSTYFSLNYLRVSPGNLINLSNSSFTIECWVWSEDYYATDNTTILLKTNNWQLYLQRITQYIGFWFYPYVYTSTTELVPYIWNHIAVTFNNSTRLLTIYLNGINILQTTTSSGLVELYNTDVSIGFTNHFKGFIKDVRIVKDAVVYANNFANNLPTQPLEIHSSGNTLLLTCQNSTIIDNSTSPKTFLEEGGTVTRHLFSPTPFASQSEIVTTGPGNKNFVVQDNNLNIVTNNSAFSHTGSGDGIGWLNLVHTEPRIIDTVRTGSGDFSKAIASSAVSKSTISANTVYSSRTTVSEGDTVTWYVITDNIADGTTLYWTDSGTTNSSDWLGGATSGSFIVVNDVATISRTSLLDLDSESAETSILNIRTGSISGTIIATSDTVNILNRVFSITVTPSSTTVSEGDTITWTVTTTNLPDGTTLYWTYTGTNIYDWVDQATSGSFVVINNTATISRTLNLDINVESTESSTLQIRTGSISGTIIATSNTVSILNRAFSVTVTPSSTTVSEGNTIIWTVTTTNLQNGATLYWTDSGTTSSSDWVGGATSGSFVVSNNAATISRTVVLDAVSEGTESSVLRIRVGSIGGDIVATSATVNILNA